MRFVADVVLERADGLQRPAKRRVEFEAASLDEATRILPEVARKGGYSGFRLERVLSLVGEGGR